MNQFFLFEKTTIEENLTHSGILIRELKKLYIYYHGEMITNTFYFHFIKGRLFDWG